MRWAPYDEISMKFAIILEKTATPGAFQAAVPGHVAYLKRLHDEGILIAAGPFRDACGGMVLIDVEDENAARKIAEADPFIIEKVEQYTLRSWEVLSDVRSELLTRDG